MYKEYNLGRILKPGNVEVLTTIPQLKLESEYPNLDHPRRGGTAATIAIIHIRTINAFTRDFEMISR